MRRSSPPDRAQLSLPGLGGELVGGGEVSGTPCTPGDPLSHLNHKNKVIFMNWSKMSNPGLLQQCATYSNPNRQKKIDKKEKP